MTRIDILSLAHRSPFKTKGDVARAEADVVASLASDGFITTRRAAGLYGDRWTITVEGLKFLNLMTAVVEEDDSF